MGGPKNENCATVSCRLKEVQSCVKMFLLSFENDYLIFSLPTKNVHYGQCNMYFSQPFPKPGRNAFTILCKCPIKDRQMRLPLGIKLVRDSRRFTASPILRAFICSSTFVMKPVRSTLDFKIYSTGWGRKMSHRKEAEDGPHLHPHPVLYYSSAR